MELMTQWQSHSPPSMVIFCSLSLWACAGVSTASSHEFEVKQSHYFPHKYHQGEIVIYCYSSLCEKDFTKQNNAYWNWIMFVNIGNLVVNTL